MKEAALIVFQKIPERGKVKTRLAQRIGEEKAVEVYRYLLDYTHQQVDLLRIPVYIYLDKKADQDFGSKKNYVTAVQKGEDLGEKMKLAFEEVFANGFKKVLIIGSDCLDLTAGTIQKAFSSLDFHDLVIGPAKDGGYYLIGMKKIHKTLFDNKPWSSSLVLAETLAEAKRLDLTIQLLKELSDVDVYEDLNDWLKIKFDIR